MLEDEPPPPPPPRGGVESRRAGGGWPWRGGCWNCICGGARWSPGRTEGGGTSEPESMPYFMSLLTRMIIIARMVCET